MPHLEDGTLHALLDGEIPSEELPPIEAHLAACAECRARLEAERAIRGEADGLVEAIEAPAPGVARATVGARAAPAKRPRRWLREVAWAASVVLAAGLGYASRGVRPPAPASQVTARQVAAGQVAAGQVAAGRDGSLPTHPDSGVTAPLAAAAEAAKQPVNASPAPANRTEVRREARLGKEAPVRGPAEAKKALADAIDSLPRSKGGFAVPTERLTLNAAADRATVVKLRSAETPAPAAPAGQAAGGIAQLRPRRLDTTSQLHLEEIVVTGVPANAAKVSAPVVAPAAITFPDAIARLGGTIRLIEGLVPLRVEALGDRVRVIYPLAPGELVLEQWRSAAGVTWKISAPAGFPADSVERLTARVRE